MWGVLKLEPMTPIWPSIKNLKSVGRHWSIDTVQILSPGPALLFPKTPSTAPSSVSRHPVVCPVPTTKRTLPVRAKPRISRSVSMNWEGVDERRLAIVTVPFRSLAVAMWVPEPEMAANCGPWTGRGESGTSKRHTRRSRLQRTRIDDEVGEN